MPTHTMVFINKYKRTHRKHTKAMHEIHSIEIELRVLKNYAKDDQNEVKKQSDKKTREPKPKSKTKITHKHQH